jgi:endonuclease
MPIYDRPAKTLMCEWATQHLTPGQTFEKAAPIRWFKEHYPKIKSNTIGMHVENMSVNNPARRHFPGVHAGSGHDVFFKLGPNQFRLWDKERDPAPQYKADIEAGLQGDAGLENEVVEPDLAEQPAQSEATREFAFERDLRNYLVRNLELIEPGLRLYEEEGITGVEFPVGGRYIDILAVDSSGSYVVIEMKVSRGYDRAIGQLLRYMGWIKQNMDTSQAVRGVIVANDITSDLRLASSHVPNVRLIEYEISFSLRPLE